VGNQTQAQAVTFDVQIDKEAQKIIDDYIDARNTEANISNNFQRLSAKTLYYFSKHINKNFKNVTREDIISFLNSMKKTEVEDPNHKWIGTYNLYLVIVATFLKWFCHPKIEQKERPKPEVIQNITIDPKIEKVKGLFELLEKAGTITNRSLQIAYFSFGVSVGAVIISVIPFVLLR
jgi:hypothetical protein